MSLTDVPEPSTDASTVASCPVCHALTYDLPAHAGYHTAVANADPIVLTVPEPSP